MAKYAVVPKSPLVYSLEMISLALQSLRDHGYQVTGRLDMIGHYGEEHHVEWKPASPQTKDETR